MLSGRYAPSPNLGEIKMNAHIETKSADLVIDFGGTPLNVSELHRATVLKFLQSGANHTARNEVSALVVAKFKKEEIERQNAARKAEGLPELTAEEKKDVKHNVPSDSDEYRNAFAGFLAEKLEAARNGTLGESAGRGPSVSPLDKLIADITKRDVLAILKATDLWTQAKHPKPETVFVLSSGERTFQSMLDGRLSSEKYGPAIRKEAEKRLADETKKAEAAANSSLDF